MWKCNYFALMLNAKKFVNYTFSYHTTEQYLHHVDMEIETEVRCLRVIQQEFSRTNSRM